MLVGGAISTNAALRADPRNRLVGTDENINARARPVRILGERVTTPRVCACRGPL